MGHVKTIGMGTITGAISNVVALAAGIITVPLLIKNLGTDAYGLLGVVSALVGFVGVVDLGLTSTITNAIAYGNARADHSRINRLFSGGILLYTPLVFAIVGLVTLLVYAPWFPLASLLNITPDVARLARLVIVIMLSYTMAGAFWGGVLKSLYHGVNDVAIYNGTQTIYNSFFALAFILYLLFGQVTLLGVVLVQAVGALVRLLLFVGVATRRYTWFSFIWSRESVRVVAPLLNYSVILFLSMVCIVILERSDNIVLAHYLGLAAVASYSIVYKLFYLPAAMLPIATASAPTVAALYEQKDWAALATLYRRILRVNIILKFIVFAFLLVFAREIVVLWVGVDLFTGYGTVAAIAATYMVFAWNGTHSLFFGAMQNFKPELRANAISIVLNLAFSIYLVQKIGMAGVPLGTLLSFLLVNAWYLPRTLVRLLDIHPWREAVRLLSRIVPLLLALVAVHYFLITLVTDNLPRYILAAVIGVLFMFAVFLVAFGPGEKQFIVAGVRNKLQGLLRRV